MNFTHIKRVLLSALLLCSLFLTTIYANGSQNNKTSTDQKLEDVQNQIEDAENEIDKFNDQKENLENDLKDLNSNLQSLANDVNTLERGQ